MAQIGKPVRKIISEPERVRPKPRPSPKKEPAPV